MEKHAVTRQKTQALTINAVIMALYVALSLITPIAAGPIQFRISESLNHLVVFNKKYLWGIFGGCVIYNALFGYGIMDVLFGGGQTLLALSATALISRFTKSYKVRMFWNVLFFTVSMFLIALMLQITGNLPFWATYGTLMLSELVIMSISAPLMYFLNSGLDFGKRI